VQPVFLADQQRLTNKFEHPKDAYAGTKYQE
jgi:hypothetical protein